MGRVALLPLEHHCLRQTQLDLLEAVILGQALFLWHCPQQGKVLLVGRVSLVLLHLLCFPTYSGLSSTIERPKA